MFWRCFSWNELGPIVPLEGSVIGKTHTKVIQKYVVSTLQKHFPHGNRIFQENNATSHHSKVVAATHENVKIVILPWPTQSPDLNPIENLWTEMKMMVRCHTPPLSNIWELEKYIKDAWKDVPLEYYKKLIDSMPQRI